MSFCKRSCLNWLDRCTDGQSVLPPLSHLHRRRSVRHLATAETSIAPTDPLKSRRQHRNHFTQVDAPARALIKNLLILNFAHALTAPAPPRPAHEYNGHNIQLAATLHNCKYNRPRRWTTRWAENWGGAGFN